LIRYINKKFVCILDEIQLINKSEISPLGSLLTLGRKFGLSLWFSTQYLDKKTSVVKRYEQAASRLIITPTESDIDIIINKLLGKKDKSWKELMAKLKTGICIFRSINNADADKYDKIVKVFSIEDTIALLKDNK